MFYDFTDRLFFEMKRWSNENYLISKLPFEIARNENFEKRKTFRSISILLLTRLDTFVNWSVFQKLQLHHWKQWQSISSSRTKKLIKLFFKKLPISANRFNVFAQLKRLGNWKKCVLDLGKPRKTICQKLFYFKKIRKCRKVGPAGLGDGIEVC